MVLFQEPHAGYLEPVARKQVQRSSGYIEPPFTMHYQPLAGYQESAVVTQSQPQTGYHEPVRVKYSVPHVEYLVPGVGTYGQPHAGYLEPAVGRQSRTHAVYSESAVPNYSHDPYLRRFFRLAIYCSTLSSNFAASIDIILLVLLTDLVNRISMPVVTLHMGQVLCWLHLLLSFIFTTHRPVNCCVVFFCRIFSSTFLCSKLHLCWI